MFARGLMDEVRALLSSGVPESCTAMQAIGYKEAVAALRGECSEAEARAMIQQESRRYAKRQLTWFRRDKEIEWHRFGSKPDLGEALQHSTAFLRSRGIE